MVRSLGNHATPTLIYNGVGRLLVGAATVFGGGRVGHPRDEHRQALNRERQRRWRARRQGRNCAASCWVTYDNAVVDMLVRLRWLIEAKAADVREIAQAISALLADIAHRS